MHESKTWRENSFVTLTYGRDRLPPGENLCHADFQKFMKRLRKKYTGREVRFYMCGEYGGETGRPHYHACLFNKDFADRVPKGRSGSGELFYKSAELEELWGEGLCSVQDLNHSTAGYCTRYIMEKQLGKDSARADGRVPEYNAMSLKPGIGYQWFAKYKRDVFPHDFVIADGVKRQVPEYYNRLAKRDLDIDVDAVEFKRQKAAIASLPDNSDDRRAVREQVHLARVRSLARGL